MCTNKWTPHFARVFETRFDHHVCLASLTETARSQPARDLAAHRGFSVLHLSDLHYGHASQGDVDWKVWIDGSERTQRVDRIPTYLEHLPSRPDFVVVSGDITLGGDPDGFSLFQNVLVRAIKDGKLPDARHIVIVPGNHDVDRKSKPRSNQRWESFQNHFGTRFVVPWLPIHERPERLLALLGNEQLESDSVLGGHQRMDTYGLVDSAPYPFVLDKAKKVLIYAFNSSLISGSQLASGSKLENYLELILQMGKAPPNYEELRSELSALRSVDPARIEPSEIGLFHGIVETLRRRVPEVYDGCLKIAVLHHHVVPFIPEEVKQFELLLNAGQFKKQLVDAGFHVVLHGHKHWADMIADTSLPGGAELLVVSGGTIGGGPAEGKPGFNWLAFERGNNISQVRRHFIPVGSDSVDDAVNGAMASPKQTKTLWTGTRNSQRVQRLTFDRLRRSVEDGLLRYLVLKASASSSGGGQSTHAGWNNYLGDDSISVLGTAYCCLSLLAIDSEHQTFVAMRPSIASYLQSVRRANGYWSSTANLEPGQPLESIVVLDALIRLGQVDIHETGRRLLQEILEGLWPTLYRSTYAISMCLRFAQTHFPEHPSVGRFRTFLLESACRSADGAIVGWSRVSARDLDCTSGEAEALGPHVAPTAMHTAFALSSLNRASGTRFSEDDAGGILKNDAAVAFLLQSDWHHLSSEAVVEAEGKALVFNHTTPAVVTMSLLQCGLSPRHEKIRFAIHSILQSQKDGLWDFGQIRRPSWCTLDNVLALKSYAQSLELSEL